MYIPNIKDITLNLLFSYILLLFDVICLTILILMLYFQEVPCRDWNDQFDNLPEFL